MVSCVSSLPYRVFLVSEEVISLVLHPQGSGMFGCKFQSSGLSWEDVRGKKSVGLVADLPSRARQSVRATGVDRLAARSEPYVAERVADPA